MEKNVEDIDEKTLIKKENVKDNNNIEIKEICKKEEILKETVSIVNLLKKGSDGYYNYNDLINLDLKDFIELFINETSYQETMNVVRLESYKNSKFSEIIDENC